MKTTFAAVPAFLIVVYIENATAIRAYVQDNKSFHHFLKQFIIGIINFQQKVYIRYNIHLRKSKRRHLQMKVSLSIRYEIGFFNKYLIQYLSKQSKLCLILRMAV